jgi:farnesyl-diphosphate farnesyltransferase
MSDDSSRSAAAPTSEVTPERLHELLTLTSRTFALNIPLLEEPTRCEVTTAYLLFRVADTLEDATEWPRPRKLAELERFGALVRGTAPDRAASLAAEWARTPPCRHAGYLELLAELPFVMQVTAGLAPAPQRLIRAHTLRTVEGMSSFLSRQAGGEVRLRDMAELREYCYTVAGIVGEMLTELFLLERPLLEPAAPTLRRLAPIFGEALQLVNILKDAAGDSHEGRHFLPAGRFAADVFAMAHDDLDQAAHYVACLARAAAPRGMVAFTALPLLLAQATIERVETRGAGSKITRTEVQRLAERLDEALARGTVAQLVERTRH